MNEKLTQADYELLGAYLDGELDDSQSRQVASRLQGEPAMEQALRELKSLESALDAYQAPAPPPDLANRIIQAGRALPMQQPLVIRAIKWGAPLAAAAAVIVVVFALSSRHHPQVGSSPDNNRVTAQSQQVDEAVIENLDFFKSYETVETIAGNAQLVDADTMKALDRLENMPEGNL